MDMVASPMRDELTPPILKNRPVGHIDHPVGSAINRSAPNRQPASQPRQAGLVEELTDRELAVLRYPSSPMSVRDMAGELYVSLNTMKAHCRAIYRELAVTDRKAAVQADRDADLL
jgi:LuxR family maltose regulon positive regulatory protein